MRTARVALVILALAAVGCESLGVPQRLVTELQARGLPAALGVEIQGGIFSGQGRNVCVGNEGLTVYEFADEEGAIDAAATVNRNDPSNVGDAIIEWVGPPRFWLRDRAIVVYVGRDEKVDAALRTILGPPFAEAAGFMGRGLPHFDMRCEPAT